MCNCTEPCENCTEKPSELKLLLTLGNGKTKIVTGVYRAEQFADFHRVFEAKGNEMASEGATIKNLYWLIFSKDTKKPVRAQGFEVVT